jgi:hypothetical protein
MSTLAQHLLHIQNSFDNHIRLIQIDGMGAVLYKNMCAICRERGKFGLQFVEGLLELSRGEIVTQPYGF